MVGVQKCGHGAETTQQQRILTLCVYTGGKYQKPLGFSEAHAGRLLSQNFKLKFLGSFKLRYPVWDSFGLGGD